MIPSQTTQHRYSPASLNCISVKPNHLLHSSRDLAWRDVLLDHQEATGRSDIFETHPTDDVTLVVAVRGRQLIQVYKQGVWRSAVYEVGNAGLTQPQETTRMFWQALDAENRFETAHLYLSGAMIAEVAEEYRRIGTRHIEQPLSALVFRDLTIASVAGTLNAAMHEGVPDIYAEQSARFLTA